MAHNSTVFSQILKLIPRHEFETLAKQHHQGRKLRVMTRWSQFVAITSGHLSGRQSLRDIVINLRAQGNTLYHLGSQAISRTSLARANEQQPYTLYEALFAKLYSKCRYYAPGHSFRFKNKLYSLDASLIDLSLKIFPWAHYALGKAAVKLHVALDHEGLMPAFAAVTHGHTSDLEFARTLTFPKKSIVVFDKGYPAYNWFKSLIDKDIYFVTRPRKNAVYHVIERGTTIKKQGITSDQVIQLKGQKAEEANLPTLRRIGYRDTETGKQYFFLTNIFHLSASTIAEIYKQRWQIELFFKWVKQNLKIKSFLGTSKNAILTQIWIALCTTLILTYLKFASKIGWSLQVMIRLIQVNLFMRRDLLSLFYEEVPDNNKCALQSELGFT